MKKENKNEMETTIIGDKKEKSTVNVKRTNPFLIGFILIIFAAFLGLIGFGFFYGVKQLSGIKTAEVISFNKGEIKTIYSLFGTKRITGFSYNSGTNYEAYTLNYDNDDITPYEIETYISALIEDGFVISSESIRTTILKKTTDSSKKLFVTIQEREYSYEIEYKESKNY